MNQLATFLFYLFFSAITMALGWALRGTIGGGVMGAMIPGAMIALALSIMLGRTRSTAWLAVCCVVGFGIGGQMTYGQTIGLIRNPETYYWGLAGLTTKGAVWGLMGGLLLGAGLVRHELQRQDYGRSMLLAVLGSWIGWAIINKTRLINFSYKTGEDPRPEIWAGLLFGALFFTAYFTWRGKARIPLWFGIAGLLFGGFGFGMGGTFQAWGAQMEPPYNGYHWWKIMEYFFGLMLGLGYGLVAYIHRKELGEPATYTRPKVSSSKSGIMKTVGFTAFIVFFMYLLVNTPIVAGFTLLGALLFDVAYSTYSGSWHMAITLTCTGFFADLARYITKEKNDISPNETWPWLLALFATLLVAKCVTKWSTQPARTMLPKAFFLLLWSSVFVAITKGWVIMRYKSMVTDAWLFTNNPTYASFFYFAVVITVCLAGWLLSPKSSTIES